MAFSASAVYDWIRTRRLGHVWIPGRQGQTRRNLRVPLSCLKEFISKYYFQTKYWNERSAELPVIVVARLFGLSEAGVYAQHLPDRTPRTVRRFIEERYRRKMIHEVRMEVHKTVLSLRTMLAMERKLKKRKLCERCRKHPISRPVKERHERSDS